MYLLRGEEMSNREMMCDAEFMERCKALGKETKLLRDELLRRMDPEEWERKHPK